MNIETSIEVDVSSSNKQEINILHIGINHVNGEVVYVAGERAITRSGSDVSLSKCMLPDTSLHFDIDEDISLEEAFEGIYELVNLSDEIGRSLIAQTFAGLLFSAFKKAGIMPRGILMIVGKSGLLKTAYTPVVAQLYNCSDGAKPVTRFNSSKSFMEDTIDEYRDCTIVIDDLHTAESKTIKRNNEETAEEMIRRISDNTGRGHKEGKSSVQKEFNANLIFIGEYTIGQESTLPRVLVVPLTKRIDGTVLDKYQRSKRLLVPTFYYYFLQWYVDNFEDICSEIDSRLTEFREASSSTDIHGRLRDTEFCLNMSFMIFLEFCSESGLITEEQARTEYLLFTEYIRQIVNNNQERFQKNCDNKDYLNLIRKLYRNNTFRLSDSKDSFDKDKHDGLIHNKCLYLRSKKLESKLQLIAPEVNVRALVKELVNRGVLKPGKDRNTHQIEGGTRFYVFPLNKLI